MSRRAELDFPVGDEKKDGGYDYPGDDKQKGALEAEVDKEKGRQNGSHRESQIAAEMEDRKDRRFFLSTQKAYGFEPFRMVTGLAEAAYRGKEQNPRVRGAQAQESQPH